ncbi:hypothetical protein CONPUDRAFT_103928 [Coniophora puteana RWD-64-598 SS2]|uniref:Pentacotripeptide-repeat region of PRORP domain-containing protein n=1 Tax=Coniophora puteana (strain RWD-64-598) TaxID=741705 RepID=A0A5M3MP85_CONPW|nr:uncharacterized protein CONPUDRAFT_103928 [Coniophora puteana RWD-64-598 SS2]EIW80913.1 hypothetical protein CONPUDRAFT_103928 [Coniophora puteana RWD-64-598 SS2]
MSVCRRLLPQGHDITRVSSFTHALRASQLPSRRPRLAHYAAINSSAVLHSSSRAGEIPSSSHVQFDRTRQLLAQKLKEATQLSSAGGASTSRQAEVRTDDPLAMFLSLRCKDRSLVTKVPGSALVYLYETAAELGQLQTMELIAKDIVEVWATNTPASIDTLFMMLACMRRVEEAPFSHIDDLLEAIRDTVPSITSSATSQSLALQYLLDCTFLDAADDVALETLLPLITDAIETMIVPSNIHSAPCEPSTPSLLAFKLVDKLMSLERNSNALELFKALIKSRFIPPEAVQYMNDQASTRDFDFILRSALCKAAAHWGWHSHAILLARELAIAPPSPSPAALQLCCETLYSALNANSSPLLDLCVDLLVLLDVRDITWTIPRGLLRLFYNRAYEQDSHTAAERMYRHTQDPDVLDCVAYPPPSGRALTWLMRYLAVSSQNTHLARQLAKQVLDDGEPIPPPDRAIFISCAAVRGLASQARALWERYATGNDRQLVTGNGRTMLRMVSLFQALVSRAKSKAGYFGQGEQDDAAQSKEEEEGKAEDYSRFLSRVLDEFEECHRPLQDAEHFNLTSIARACILVGRIKEGLAAFKMLLARKEIPDQVDINVGLSAMAQHSPRDAAQVVEEMLKRGMYPDAVTYGTILHHALIHDDTQLAHALLSQMREQSQELSSKTVTSLIHASMQSKDGSASSKPNIRRAWDIISTLDRTKHGVPPSVGKHCADAALQADDPEMAFKFWEAVMREKVEWDDRKHVLLRTSIARVLRRHCEAERISRSRVEMMLARMRQGPRS